MNAAPLVVPALGYAYPWKEHNVSVFGDMKENILIIDDDSAIRDGCCQVLKKSGYDVVESATGKEGLEKIDRYEFDLLLLDLKLPDINGLDLIRQAREKDLSVPIVVITGYGTIQNAVEAMRLGANDFLPKPFEPDELRMVVQRNLTAHRLAMENLYLREELKKKEGEKKIIGKSPQMEALFRQVNTIALTDSTVLITGESGTGKGLLARYIHDQSARKDFPFVSVDCSTLVPTLFESELFGHVKGAFTGAESNKIGKFELASGGTLFLDEIGNVNLELQAKLLKAVEEKEISRVGSHRVTRVDVRIIAATNKNLRKEVEKGTFREDLFFRLNVLALRTPPLRERQGDIPELVRYFLDVFGKKYKRTGLAVTPALLAIFEEYRWPGNVRELENIIERLVIFSRDRIIGVEDLALAGVRIGERIEKKPGSGADTSKVKGKSGSLSLSDMERRHVLSVLEQTGGNRSEAARLLGIDRKTLRHKLKKWGVQ